MKYISYITYLLSIVLLSACTLVGSIDDIQPENVLTDETLITDAYSAQSAVNGVYDSWRTINVGWFVNYYSVLSGTQMPPSIVGIQDFSQNTVKPDNIAVKRIYLSSYNVINMANSVIAAIEKNPPKGVGEEQLNKFLSEVKFNRALAHFNLLRIFGEFYDTASPLGVVVYTEPARENIAKARASVAEVYELVIADLQYAATHGKLAPADHATVGQTAAKALLAKVYLSKGNFAEAVKWSKIVMDEAAANGYGLETDYLNIFRNRFHSSEVFFAPNTSYPKEYSFMFTNNFQPGNTLKKIANELIEGDGNDATGEGYDPRYAKIYSSQAIASANNFANKNNKYLPETYLQGSAMNTFIMLRLGEIYLIAAEAEARLKNFDAAQTYLQTICSRAGYSDDYVKTTITEENILEMILKHKWMELNAENNEEWFDLVRYKKWDNLVLSPYYIEHDNHLLMPIPRAALAGNNQLKQNPGYDK